ncbi:glutaredoxin 3 [Croceicoccus sp. F390]|uniref:Glutaredoxin n=1 Tax=Croceicoccus esteveae TaxID=3075597 RepID=A0ABU2ZFW7_9SPHN|nr:glutaredoxin 3 [Croceicoccus sp. F390]MDT0575473.1 glutaredoxin 3 [Croceicoccus sp. F390]
MTEQQSQAGASPKVEIYTKYGCPYCHRAVALLNKKNVAFEEYDISGGGPRRDEMQSRRPDARTVPQIFIDDQPVGGSDELMALESSGKLDALLGR